MSNQILTAQPLPTTQIDSSRSNSPSLDGSVIGPDSVQSGRDTENGSGSGITANCVGNSDGVTDAGQAAQAGGTNGDDTRQTHVDRSASGSSGSNVCFDADLTNTQNQQIGDTSATGGNVDGSGNSNNHNTANGGEIRDSGNSESSSFSEGGSAQQGQGQRQGQNSENTNGNENTNGAESNSGASNTSTNGGNTQSTSQTGGTQGTNVNTGGNTYRSTSETLVEGNNGIQTLPQVNPGQFGDRVLFEICGNVAQADSTGVVAENFTASLYLGRNGATLRTTRVEQGTGQTLPSNAVVDLGFYNVVTGAVQCPVPAIIVPPTPVVPPTVVPPVTPPSLEWQGALPQAETQFVAMVQEQPTAPVQQPQFTWLDLVASALGLG
jgi:hypothetical protein